MSQATTREVCVLSNFTERDGTARTKGDVFDTPYATDRDRKRVNDWVGRGFVTFDVSTAKKHLAKD